MSKLVDVLKNAFYYATNGATIKEINSFLEQLDKDEGASIVLEGTDTGVTLMVTSSEGEEMHRFLSST